MAIRSLRYNDDEILRKRCRPVDEVTDRIRDLLNDMAETMYAENGAGLAACQVGILKRLAILTRYGIVKERTAALMTDAIRANLLECCGYRTQLLEFIDLAHTPKNILIRAVKRAPGEKAPAGVLKEARALMEEFSLSPTLYRLLEEAGKIPDRVQ